MFDGSGMHHPDQLFHQFISSSSSSPPTSSRPPPPPSSLHQQHHHNHLQQISSPFTNFDNSSTSFLTPSPSPPPPPPNHQSIQFHDLFHGPNLPSSFPHLNQAPPLSQPHHLIIPKQYNDHQQSHISTDLAVEVHHQKDVGLVRALLPSPPCSAKAANLVVEREIFSSSNSSSLPQHLQSLHQSDNIWSNEEVVALLRIRSSSESSWFPPEFTWEHVSRKLAEIGFKRSAEKCKEKFEEESRTYFNTACFNINTFNNNGSGNKINNDSNNTNKVSSELEGFCTTGDDNIENKAANADDREEDPINNDHQDMEVDANIGCEKRKMYNDNVFEDVRVAAHETNEDANYPSLSPVDHSQPNQHAKPDQQSDHPALVDGREQPLKAKVKKRIRKRNKEIKFKIMKVLCEGFVNKMMSQQEELHNKILNDWFRRDEENVVREEAWKRMEMERLNSDIEMSVQEQAIAGDRQAAIIEFLNKFGTTKSATSSSHQNQNQCIIDENIVEDLLKVLPKPISHISNQIFDKSQNHNPSDPTPQNLLHETLEPQTPTSTIQPNSTITKLPPPSNPSALPIPNTFTTTSGYIITSTALVEFNPKPPTKKGLDQGHGPDSAMASSTNNSRSGLAMTTSGDFGKRWPRDEVLALINLRCSFMTNNNNNGDEDNGRDINGSKAPLWERISQKMSELGYKRSAKRCKEKWENINKYFRKTKDNVKKKRSLDSRTCPYFHQLSHLYNQGTLVAPSNESEHQLSAPENRVPDALEDCSHAGEGGDKKNMQL